MNLTPLGDGDMSIMLTTGATDGALLTVRGKDHDLDAEQLRSLSRCSLQAADEVLSFAEAWVRPVMFFPNPMALWQIPIASVVHAAGKTGLVFAELLPTRESLGGLALYTLLQCAVETLRKWDDIAKDAELPVSLGPHFSFGGRIEFTGAGLSSRAGRDPFSAAKGFASSTLPQRAAGKKRAMPRASDPAVTLMLAGKLKAANTKVERLQEAATSAIAMLERPGVGNRWHHVQKVLQDALSPRESGEG